MLKRELQAAFEKNRSTPNFNSQDYAIEMSAFDELMHKEERVSKLEKEIKEIRKSESESQEKVGVLMKENGRLKDMVKSF
jgi:superfamily II RNA helicase